MITTPLSSLSLEDLQTLIISIVDDRLTKKYIVKQMPSQQKLQEIFSSIDLNIWIPPVSVPSTLEILQEERNQ